MTKKIFYFDCETTGVDPARNAIIQLAYIIDYDHVTVAEGNLLIRPFTGNVIEKKALEVNKRTAEEIFKDPFLPPAEGYRQLMAVLNKHIDRYSREDKFYAAGYNVSFDCNFLGKFFEKNNDVYYGSYFNGRNLCAKTLLAFLDMRDRIEPLKDHKLGTVCAHYGIALDAHDALSDIRATRELTTQLLDACGGFEGVVMKRAS